MSKIIYTTRSRNQPVSHLPHLLFETLPSLLAMDRPQRNRKVSFKLADAAGYSDSNVADQDAQQQKQREGGAAKRLRRASDDGSSSDKSGGSSDDEAASDKQQKDLTTG